MLQCRQFVVVLCLGWVLGVLPAALAQGPPDLSGTWAIDRAPGSADFSGPALGPEITIDQTVETITVKYSLNRMRTWPLDGTEARRLVRVADAGSYYEIGSAVVDGDRLILRSRRDRGGRIAREQRILRLDSGRLVVQATGWLDDAVVHTSTLTYSRVAPDR